MSKIPRLTGKEMIKTLGRAGFEVSRLKGSHHFLKHFDGRCTVVPVHGTETIGIDEQDLERLRTHERTSSGSEAYIQTKCPSSLAICRRWV